jgi:elongation of very long chain fatty acids protein 4
MLLQTFHHAGIVLISWGFVVTKNTGAGVVLVCFNAFIHTIMYTYYVFAAFGFNSPLKKYLTQAQLIQFVVGGGLLIPTFFIEGCVNPAQAITTKAIHAYLVVLIYLFYQFYVQSYTKKTDKSERKQK